MDRKFKRGYVHQKGAIMIVMVLVVVISTLTSSLFLMNKVFAYKKDDLIAKYYQRAIATALSCRDVAMARLSNNFLYRTTAGPINFQQILPEIHRLASTTIFSDALSKVNCTVSIKDATGPKDLLRINNILSYSSSSAPLSNPTVLKLLSASDSFIEIISTGYADLPVIFDSGRLNVSIRSIAGISNIFPIIVYSEI